MPPSGSKESNKAKRPIAELFGVGTGAIQSWISGRGQPIAEKRLLTHLFLHEASLEGSNYPALKANENFLELQRELAATEDKIAYSRQYYNDSILSYNNLCQSFPGNMFAKLYGRQVLEFLQIREEERVVPKAEF